MLRVRNGIVDLEARSPGGHWTAMRDHGRTLEISAGVTGNRLDPHKPVPRIRWRLSVLPDGRGSAEVRRAWPVPADCTPRPGEVVADLRGELRESGADEDQIDESAAAIAEWIRRRQQAVAADPTPGSLGLVLCASAFPLLARPVAERGVPRTIPLLAGPLLRRPDPRRAAGHLGCAVTRPLVRALAASLLHGEGPIAFDPLCVALLAGPVCGPEQVTEILSTAPAAPGAAVLTHRHLAAAHGLFARRRPRRVARDLVRALAEPDGLAGLVRELEAFDPRPPAPPRQPPAAPARPGPPAPARPPRAGAQVANRPQPARAERSSTSALTYPPAWRALRGARVAGHRVLLPGRADDLVGWGREMGNCLAALRETVAAGATRILGLDDGRGLQYALEVSASGALRQFEQRQNRPPPPDLARLVVAELRGRGVVRTDARAGVRA